VYHQLPKFKLTILNTGVIGSLAILTALFTFTYSTYQAGWRWDVRLA